ncbi:hypothetical protein ACKLNO_03680 [Neisseriaceae bacterium B1]
MNIWQFFMSALLGGLSTASLIVMAQSPKIEAIAPPPMRPVAQIITCDNVPAFAPEELGEIRQLRQNCEAAAQAVVLLQIWEQDPTAGQVWEEE